MPGNIYCVLKVLPHAKWDYQASQISGVILLNGQSRNTRSQKCVIENLDDREWKDAL